MSIIREDTFVDIISSIVSRLHNLENYNFLNVSSIDSGSLRIGPKSLASNFIRLVGSAVESSIYFVFPNTTGKLYSGQDSKITVDNAFGLRIFSSTSNTQGGLYLSDLADPTKPDARIYMRNGVVFCMTPDGNVKQIAP